VPLTAEAFEISTRSSNGARWSSTAYTLSLTQGESLPLEISAGDDLDEIFVVAQRGGDSLDNPDYLITQERRSSFLLRIWGL
jgi:hypothetical protein